MATIGRHVSKLSGHAPAKRTTASGQASGYGLHLVSVAQSANATGLPPRPDPNILSDAIPLFFIGQDKDGFWVAREADGRIGGIFLRKQSAVRFAHRTTQPAGCATMILSERFELDVENKGNPLVARLAAAKLIVLQRAQRTAPWAFAMAKRAHPVALLLGLFAAAFTATIVLRLAIWLAVLAVRSVF